MYIICGLGNFAVIFEFNDKLFLHDWYYCSYLIHRLIMRWV